MTVAAVLALIALAIVLVALVRDRGAVGPPAVRAPTFDGLPAPSDLAGIELPAAMTGYDPAAVEALLDEVRGAYAELWSAAGADGRDRAAQAFARRRGAFGPASPRWSTGHVGDERRPWTRLPAQPGSGPVSALGSADGLGELRAEVSLAALDPGTPPMDSALDPVSPPWGPAGIR